MTNKEALISELPFEVDDMMIEKSLIDNSVTGSSTYVADSAESIDLCVVKILQRLLSEPDITEGGYSKKFDRSAAEKRLLYLAKKYGMTDIVSDLTPTITSKSVW
jgi:hypothetical protein